FNHAMDARIAWTLVELKQPSCHLGICLGPALIMSDIFHPCRNMIALGPDFGVFQVPEEHPLPGAIANPDATSFDHNSQELRNVVLGDDIIDHDEDRAAS